MGESLPLTEQQLAIIQHEKGPALVFAVAGSGKTTSMIYRIKQLVEKGICQPQQILATSFSKATVRDISEGLQRIGVAGVRPLTLHALGYRIIRKAAQRGHFPTDFLQANPQQEALNEILTRRTINQLSAKYKRAEDEFKIDGEELNNQISAWKGNLFYPDLKGRKFSKKIKKWAKQADHSNPYFIEAYQFYEKLRLEQKWLTFDDMLLTAWELLMQHKAILEETRLQYDMILVDEFQDVNLVQYLLLDLLSHPHRNYMAIGDDDQCIYEWRGASPNFILNFEEEYGATTYLINDNFRSTGHQVLLANEVIHQNTQRKEKVLSLTRGFGGNCFIMKAEDAGQEPWAIVDEIQAKHKEGEPFASMAILVRLYAQTPGIETQLIRQGIPYQVIGNTPFYQRPEITTLFKYLRFALTEKQIQAKNAFPAKLSEQKRYIDDFRAILLAPNKYVTNAFTEDICRRALRNKSSVLSEMMSQMDKLHERVQDQLDFFLHILEKLMDKIEQPAGKVMKWLVFAIDYKGYLIKSSGVEELGLFKWENIQSLIAFSAPYANSESLLKSIYHVASDYLTHKKAKEVGIHLMTIYRAKGLEWPTVFIPGCNQGIFPYLKGGENSHEIEEERRLFYVGITRAKKDLYFSFNEEDPISQFLTEVDSETVIEDAYTLKELLPQQSNLKEAFQEKLENTVKKYPLDRFFQKWFQNSKP